MRKMFRAFDVRTPEQRAIAHVVRQHRGAVKDGGECVLAEQRLKQRFIADVAAHGDQQRMVVGI